MKTIEQTSLSLLAIALVLLVLAVAGFGLNSYMSHPSLYIAPPESKDISSAKSVRESTNLEGLKSVCTFWAERDDQSRQFLNAMNNQYVSLVRELAIAVVVLSMIFSGGLLYIYLAARRMRRAQKDAL